MEPKCERLKSGHGYSGWRAYVRGKWPCLYLLLAWGLRLKADTVRFAPTFPEEMGLGPRDRPRAQARPVSPPQVPQEFLATFGVGNPLCKPLWNRGHHIYWFTVQGPMESRAGARSRVRRWGLWTRASRPATATPPPPPSASLSPCPALPSPPLAPEPHPSTRLT